MPEPILLSPETQRAVIAEAARAPSVHNVQPARWRFGGDGSVLLLRELGRELSVGDPSGHDLSASLGAAYEGMQIALSRLGFRLVDPTEDRATLEGSHQSILRSQLERGAELDALSAYVGARHSYRGKFRPVRSPSIPQLDDTVVLTRADVIERVAMLHDTATWHFESQRRYHAELWSWLRLNPSDPRYSLDGLNADCLSLSAIERVAARIALRPAVFAALSRVRIGRQLVSERAQVRSASAIVLFTPLATRSAFDVGRRFYRLWLELTRAGVHVAPMSASSDHAPTRTVLATDYGVSPDRRIANVLRVGSIDESKVAVSPRLPVDELAV